MITYTAKSSQVVLTAATPTLLAPASRDRVHLQLMNPNANAIYVGGSDVSQNNGFLLGAQFNTQVIKLDGDAAAAAVYGVFQGSGSTIFVLEVVKE